MSEVYRLKDGKIVNQDGEPLLCAICGKPLVVGGQSRVLALVPGCFGDTADSQVVFYFDEGNPSYAHDTCVHPERERRKRALKASLQLVELIHSHFDRSVSNPEEMAQAILLNPDLKLVFPVVDGRGDNLFNALRRWLEDCDGSDNNDCRTCPLAEAALVITHGDEQEEVYTPSYCDLFQQLENNLADDDMKKGEKDAK